MVAIQIQARRVEDADAFIEALEGRGTFHNVLPTEEQTAQSGLIEAVLEGEYVPRPREVGQPSPVDTSTPAPNASRGTGGQR
jgi:hypothetical protein